MQSKEKTAAVQVPNTQQPKAEDKPPGHWWSCFINIGGWLYGLGGIIVFLLGVIGWGLWQWADWEIPIWVTIGSMFLGVIGTGLTIAGIGVAIHQQNVPNTRTLSSRIDALEAAIKDAPAEPDQDKLKSILNSLEEVQTTLGNLNQDSSQSFQGPSVLSRRGRKQRRKNK